MELKCREVEGKWSLNGGQMEGKWRATGGQMELKWSLNGGHMEGKWYRNPHSCSDPLSKLIAYLTHEALWIFLLPIQNGN